MAAKKSAVKRRALQDYRYGAAHNSNLVAQRRRGEISHKQLIRRTTKIGVAKRLTARGKNFTAGELNRKTGKRVRALRKG